MLVKSVQDNILQAPYNPFRVNVNGGMNPMPIAPTYWAEPRFRVFFSAVLNRRIRPLHLKELRIVPEFGCLAFAFMLWF